MRDHELQLPGGRPRLAVTEGEGAPDRRAVLLVHGLSSNRRLWDGVAARLSGAGHRTVAVDQRGHGGSELPDGGFDTDTCADDLAALVGVAGLSGAAGPPLVVGQSWGGNVVLSLAARHPGSVGAVCFVDGGWIRLASAFADREACWAALAPPSFDHLRWSDMQERVGAWMSPAAGWPRWAAAATLANLAPTPDGGVRARLPRSAHREIVMSLYDGDPRLLYPRVAVPALLCPAVGPRPLPGEDARAAAAREAVLEALAALPQGRVSWYEGAHHDLHAQHADRLAADLLDLLALTDLPGGAPADREASPA